VWDKECVEKSLPKRDEIEHIQPHCKRLAGSVKTAHSPHLLPERTRRLHSSRKVVDGLLLNMDVLRQTLLTSSHEANLLQQATNTSRSGCRCGLGCDAACCGGDGGGLIGEYGDGDGDSVGDEEVKESEVCADDELGDLEGCKSLLDLLGNADFKGGDGVVSVLFMSAYYSYTKGKRDLGLTIIA
jgi:hypothetical protein